MTYLNAKKYIQGAPNMREKSSIDFSELFTLLSNPQRRLKYIRLAGSCGKSICLEMLRNTTLESGCKVGCLRMLLCDEPRQNIYIGNSPVSMEEFADYTAQIRSACAQMNISPTRIEILLCIALLAFKDHACELCIIESSNGDIQISKALPFPISVVICGKLSADDREHISDIQSYICRGVKEVVCATQSADIAKTVSNACYNAGCRLTLPSRRALEISKQSFLTTEFSYKSKFYKLRLGGTFQARNAALVIEAVYMLQRCGYTVSADALTRGLEATKALGKFEFLSISPVIIANCVSSVTALDDLCQTLAEFEELQNKTLRLCIPCRDVIDVSCKKLTESGFAIESIYTVAQDGQAPENVISFKTSRKLSVAMLNGLTSDTVLLILGDINFVEDVRYNVLAKLGY